MVNKKWQDRFYELAKHVSSWSNDPSTKCGAVIVDQETNQVISLGFNGYPKGVPNTEHIDSRNTKLLCIQHAERNAILFATSCIKEKSMFIYPMLPCTQCAGAIINAGIRNVYTLADMTEQYVRWNDQFNITREMFHSVRINLLEKKETY